MSREYVAWDSPALGRRMEMLFFGHSGRPMIWFPTSQGRFYQYEDFGLIATVSDLLGSGALQIACVDSVDAESFYATGRPPAERIRRHDAYDHYIAREVVPWLLSRALPAGKVGTLGTSFGAYHAVNFGLRHPDLCDKVVGFSGKYDIHSFLDGYWDELCYFHCPTAYVPNMDGEWVTKLSAMDIAIVTGETDNILSGTTDMMRIFKEKGIRNRNSVWAAPYGHCPTAYVPNMDGDLVRRLSTIDIAIVTGETDNILEGSREMIRILEGKGIPHRGHIWRAPYGHDWQWWKEQIRSYVP